LASREGREGPPAQLWLLCTKIKDLPRPWCSSRRADCLPCSPTGARAVSDLGKWEGCVPEFSDSIVFADESGDHTLGAVDPTYPMFVLAFCLAEKEAYASRIVPAVLRFKFQHFGHDQVILHEHDIRKNKGPFALIRDPARRTPFMEGLNTLMRDAPIVLIACAVHKQRHLDRYSNPENPYHVALGFLLERLYAELAGQGCRAGATHILFERRGPKEDAELELEFRRIRDGANYYGKRLPFEGVFCDKKCNSSGLQLAELMARPIGRHVLDPAQPNRAYDILEQKFRRSPQGRVRGWGLKEFP
jgi:hypothetical protein